MESKNTSFVVEPLTNHLILNKIKNHNRKTSKLTQKLRKQEILNFMWMVDHQIPLTPLTFLCLSYNWFETRLSNFSVLMFILRLMCSATDSNVRKYWSKEVQKECHPSLLKTWGFSTISTYNSFLPSIFGTNALIWGYFWNVRKGCFWGHWGQRVIKVEFWGCDLEILSSFLKVWLPTSKK